MRKQTKLVAVLSATALLAIGASMTSFAKGWQKSDDGTWQYYDKNDNQVTGEWAKDGAKWFYLDDDGNMLTDSWVDDEYYVGDDGAMLVNSWKKVASSDSVDDPDSDGEYWYYFGSKGKRTTESKKINGKTYYFNEDGQMQTGWYQVDSKDIYYLGDDDQGWRTENGWLWLEKPEADDNIVFNDNIAVENDDDEAWYYFGSSGKMYQDANKKKVNGKYYYFSAHGQMLYEWINNQKVSATTPTNAVLDGHNGASANATPSSVGDLLYMNPVEEGYRADGWYEIDGSQDAGTDNDTDWYYFSDGKAKAADAKKGDTVPNIEKDKAPVVRAKIKIKASNNKYFCFDEMGRMKTGLQYIPASNGFYFFDDNGYMKTGKLSNVEEDNDSYNYSFNTKNGKNGEGIQGIKDGYLYFNGKRLEADDTYKLFVGKDAQVYLVNNKGKVQTSKNRTYDIEGIGDKISVNLGNGNHVTRLYTKDGKTETNIPAAEVKEAITFPAINLYDNVYTYEMTTPDGKGATYTPNWFKDAPEFTIPNLVSLGMNAEMDN